MSLIAIWEKNPDQLTSYAIRQIVAMAGDGKLRDAGECSSELRSFLSEVDSAALAKSLPPGLEIRDWTVDHSSYFRAIRIEKTMVAVILMMIVAVAAFYLVAMLAMVVTDKRTDIAILRTLGTSPRRVMAIFLIQGSVIAWFGVALGVAFGCLLGFYAGDAAAFLERLFGFEIFNSEVYTVTRIPSELRNPQILWVAGIAMLITLLATIYPAFRASRIPPADALRYE